MLPFTDESDYIINANSAIIEVGSNVVCINVQAVDDRLIELQEIITVTINPRNDFDNVLPSGTTVRIMDNDG